MSLGFLNYYLRKSDEVTLLSIYFSPQLSQTRAGYLLRNNINYSLPLKASSYLLFLFTQNPNLS
jgi:hypothetical protein